MGDFAVLLSTKADNLWNVLMDDFTLGFIVVLVLPKVDNPKWCMWDDFALCLVHAQVVQDGGFCYIVQTKQTVLSAALWMIGLCVVLVNWYMVDDFALYSTSKTDNPKYCMMDDFAL